MFNLTLSKVKLLAKPFQNAVRDTSSNFSQIQESLDMIKDVINPIANEIEMPFNATNTETFTNASRFVRTPNPNNQQSQAEIFQQNYVTKINNRCISQFESE